MAEKQSSGSAAGVALMRAIDTQRPDGVRICDDPYAGALVPGGIGYALVRLMMTSGLYDRLAPGAMAFVALRERYVDDILKAGLAEGLDQVVILGAGFDTRAYRIAGIDKTRVFEIDEPATQKVKLERLKRVFDPLPAHVTFLPVDFNTQTLGRRLQDGGYNEQGRTLFIWQGVTYFLSAQGVDHTLSFIAGHSAPGSAVIFDYFYNEVLHDPRRADVKMMQRTARMVGEAYLFGIDQGQAEPFLTRRGFRDVRDRSLEDLRRDYLTGPNAGRVLPTGIAIVSARVGQAEG